MKRFHRYIPESFHLLASRAAEMAVRQTPREAESDAADLLKDRCDLPAGQWTGSHESKGPECRRRGVPVVFSHLYDA